MRTNLFAGLLVGCLTGGTASATALLPDSYDMLNGNTGSYQYWDDTYTGTGCLTCDGDALAGGKGDLTDGIIAADNWNITEAPAGPGPYVGWTISPKITFHWNSPVSLGSVTFYLDDADNYGGVMPPASIIVNGVTFNVADPLGAAPFAFTAGGLSFVGTDLEVQLNLRSSWVFLSEVKFDGEVVPEPGTLGLTLAGLGTLAAIARRRRSK